MNADRSQGTGLLLVLIGIVLALLVSGNLGIATILIGLVLIVWPVVTGSMRS